MDTNKYALKLHIPAQNKSDCEVIMEDVENVFGNIGNCLGAAFDDEKSKMDVTKSVFGIGKSLLKFGWHTTSCVVKHTPKAIATVANAKREFTDTITDAYQKYQKQIKEEELNEKIKQLKSKL